MKKAVVLFAVSFMFVAAPFKGISMGTYLQHHCVAQWKMNDDAANTTVDDSINGYDGTFVSEGDANTDSHSTTGKIGDCLTLDGGTSLGDYISVDDDDVFSPVLTPFSISCWIYMTSGEGYYWIPVVGKGDISVGEKDEWYIEIDEYVPAFFIRDVNNSATVAIYSASQQSALLDNWCHLVATYNGGTTSDDMNLYLNGQLLTVGQRTDNVNFVSIVNGSDPLVMGDWAGPGIDGRKIDNVQIFDIALNQQQVDYLYNGGNGKEL